jgi:hypothetical protein
MYPSVNKDSLWLAGKRRMKRVGDLQIEQDLQFERRSWVAERVGWGLMMLLVAAALAGLFGGGIASRRTIGGPGIEFEYNRFGRYDSPDTIILRVSPALTASGELRIRLSEEFLEKVQIENIDPEPDESTAGGTDRVFLFRTHSSQGLLRIRVHLIPRAIGRVAGRVGAGGVNLDFAQWIYP